MQIKENRIPIWLDCDPGHDDVVAMLLAVFHTSFNLLGVSASFGNAPIAETEYNALSIITAFGKANSIKVYHGSPKGWIREPTYAPNIHGLSGLDGTTLLPIPSVEVCKRSHLEAIKEAILANKYDISLVSTGSMTTIATLFRESPELLRYIRYIAIMGGGIGVGNVNPNFSAEFNVWVDPHAAKFILTNPLISAKCILVPLDLTHQVIATKEIRSRILGDGTSNMRKLFYELFEYFSKSCEITQAFFDGPPLHDPVALVPLLQFYDPSLEKQIGFEYERMDLDITLDNIENLGKIKCIKSYDNFENKGVMVGKALNFNFFWDTIFKCLKAATLSSTIEEKPSEKEYN